MYAEGSGRDPGPPLTSFVECPLRTVSAIPSMPFQVPYNGRRLLRLHFCLFPRPGPFEWKMRDAARLLHLLHCFERRQKHRPLCVLVPRLPHGLSERMLNSRKPRYAHGGRQVRDVRQGNGSYAATFNLPLRQSHGPAADRSSRYEYGHIDLILPKMLDDRRDAFLKKLCRFENVSHERIV